MDVRLLCLLCVVQVAAYATSLSLVQRSPTARVCVRLIVCGPETSTMRQPSHKLCHYATNKICILPLLILMNENSYHNQRRFLVVYVADVDHNLGVNKVGQIVFRSNCCENLLLSLIIQISVYHYASIKRVNSKKGCTCQGVTEIIETKQHISSGNLSRSTLRIHTFHLPIYTHYPRVKGSYLTLKVYLLMNTSNLMRFQCQCVLWEVYK